MVFDSIPGPLKRHDGKSFEPIFHPHLRHTKEVIRRPDWVRRSGEAVVHRGSLSMIALFGIMFSNCIGGGYGFEDGIGAAGPLVTLIVCVVLPWVWCMPTGLAVAELSTAVPSNSGILMWTNAAFPPFVSFMCILATLFITFIGNATYPNLTAEYVTNITTLNTFGLIGVKTGVIVLCCILNCVGVEIVGSSSIIVCTIASLPFCLLTVIQLFGHGFNRAVLHTQFRSTNWSNFFSIISWNYANIENAGSVVEEVANPQHAFPTAMVLLMLSTYMAYVLPMLAGVSCMGPHQDFSQWQAGHWTDVAKVMAGPWLQYVLFVGSLISGIGFTLTSLCCTSRLLAGMGTMHMFPRRMSRFIGYYHPRLGTPVPAIVLNSAVTMLFSLTMNFDNVVALCQSLYCLRLVVIYAAVVKLRVQYPNLMRPYALPCNTWTAAACLTPAALFSIFASVVSAMTSLAIGVSFAGFIVLGCGVSWVYCRTFAPNGFQGVIVQCEVADEEESKPSLQNSSNHTHDHNGDDNNNNNSSSTTDTAANNSYTLGTMRESGNARAIDAVGRTSVAVGTDDLYIDDSITNNNHNNTNANNNNNTINDNDYNADNPTRSVSVNAHDTLRRHSAAQYGDPQCGSSEESARYGPEETHAARPNRASMTREKEEEGDYDVYLQQAQLQRRPSQIYAQPFRMHAHSNLDHASTYCSQNTCASQFYRNSTEEQQEQREKNSCSSSARPVHVHIASDARSRWQRGQAGTQETLDEGVFYTDPEAEAAGDILLGILPLGAECETQVNALVDDKDHENNHDALDYENSQHEEKRPMMSRAGPTSQHPPGGIARNKRHTHKDNNYNSCKSSRHSHSHPLPHHFHPRSRLQPMQHAHHANRLSANEPRHSVWDDVRTMHYSNSAHRESPHFRLNEDARSAPVEGDTENAALYTEVETEKTDSDDQVHMQPLPKSLRNGRQAHMHRAAAAQRGAVTPPLQAAGMRCRVRQTSSSSTPLTTAPTTSAITAVAHTNHSSAVGMTTEVTVSTNTTPQLSVTRHAAMRTVRFDAPSSPSVFADAAAAETISSAISQASALSNAEDCTAMHHALRSQSVMRGDTCVFLPSATTTRPVEAEQSGGTVGEDDETELAT